MEARRAGRGEPNGVGAEPQALGRRLRRVLAGCVVIPVTLGSGGFAAATSAAATARAARTISITELGRLHLTSHHGFTLNEEGKALGTIAGTIYIHLHVTSTNHVSAEVNIYPHGGSVTGQASASYQPSGGTATFNGTMNVTRGTGSWNAAHGSGLKFTGTVQRSNDAVTVRVSGKIST
jgi:hypothetical protein